MLNADASTYDAIYLSPHLDDAALSCGGQIADRAAAGQRVLIVTVMAGSPPPAAASAYIASLHERWQLAGAATGDAVTDAAAERRREDVQACAILGADYLHLDVPDCIYRLDPQSGKPLYCSDEDIFGEIADAEARLAEAIAERLRRLPAARMLVAPLAVGHHVDHLLVRAAAELVLPHGLWCYEDYPYAQQPRALHRALGDEHLRIWRPDTIDVSEQGRRAKFDAIWAFRSQLSTFFTGRADMEQQVGGYMDQVRGERLWCRP